jgi:hypothetical protein
LCEEFLAEQGALLADPAGLTPLGEPVTVPDADARAREGLVRVLLNHNDFVMIR